MLISDVQSNHCGKSVVLRVILMIVLLILVLLLIAKTIPIRTVHSNTRVKHEIGANGSKRKIPNGGARKLP